jgi:hypothetical protein
MFSTRRLFVALAAGVALGSGVTLAVATAKPGQRHAEAELSQSATTVVPSVQAAATNGQAAPTTAATTSSPAGRLRAGQSTSRPAKPRRAASSTDSDSAAVRYGWNDRVFHDNFTSPSLGPDWIKYDSPGHDGKGVRSPEQIDINSGVLRISGTEEGKTAGIMWGHPRKYGRWEVRARFPAGCGCYHPVLILWPVDHPWPAGGEIDFAEVFDWRRQNLNFFVHYSADNRIISGSRTVDMTQWRNFAVEWAPDHITGFVDGEVFFHNTQQSAQPPGPMNQTVQLDWFPDQNRGGATLEVDWVSMYDL